MVNKVDYNQLGITKPNKLQIEKTEHVNISINTGVSGEKIWMGQFTAEPGATSLPQHHEQSDVVLYILKGKVTLFYGGNYSTTEELYEGDFIYVPPYQPYIFKNPSETESLEIITTMAPYFRVVYVNKNERVECPNGINQENISIVRAAELNDSTDQTKNMPRRTAVQAPNLWIGRVTGEPAKDSGVHHHGVAETAGFIISGKTRLLHGEKYEQYEEYEPGYFLRVPPFLPHIERNVSNIETIEFLTARNPRNIVVNLDN